MVISPPVFISEDEARKIIFTALKEENIDFSTINTPVLKFRVLTTVFDFHKKVINLMDKKEITVEIKMDGYNVKNNLAIEYVSASVVNRLDPYDEMESSVQRIDTKKTAERIRNELIARGKVNAAVFYDPVTWDDGSPEAIDRLLSGNSFPSGRDLLKAQVKDFIDWIKKEGIIKN
jgi:hypothetical protein